VPRAREEGKRKKGRKREGSPAGTLRGFDSRWAPDLDEHPLAAPIDRRLALDFITPVLAVLDLDRIALSAGDRDKDDIACEKA
jgi:hypothetical protein